MATETIARRQAGFGPLVPVSAGAGLTGLAITVVVALAMVLGPSGEVSGVNTLQWDEARQNHLRIEYGAPAAAPPPVLIEQQRHLQREYGPITAPLQLDVEQQKHLQREYGR